MLAARSDSHGGPLPVSAARRPKSVILIFNCGAPSHIDLWDPKPHAPDSVRGKYQPRVDMRQEALEELAISIRQQGVIQPIVVRPLARATATRCRVSGAARCRDPME